MLQSGYREWSGGVFQLRRAARARANHATEGFSEGVAGASSHLRCLRSFAACIAIAGQGGPVSGI